MGSGFKYLVIFRPLFSAISQVFHSILCPVGILCPVDRWWVVGGFRIRGRMVVVRMLLLNLPSVLELPCQVVGLPGWDLLYYLASLSIL